MPLRRSRQSTATVAGNWDYLIVGGGTFILIMAATWWLHRGSRGGPPAAPDIARSGHGYSDAMVG